MKKFTLSVVAVMAMSTFAIAGGDIAPVEEPMVEVAAPVVDDSGLYLGLAYGLGNFDTTQHNKNRSDDWNYNNIMIQAGYKFNSYIAIESRYWFGLDEDIIPFDSNPYTYSSDTWGIYVKPMYPVTDAFDIYALLGYASTDASVDNPTDSWNFGGDLDGFSWGLGAAYSFTDNLSAFIDYVNIYDDSTDHGHNGIEDVTISTWNFGLTYQF